MQVYLSFGRFVNLCPKIVQPAGRLVGGERWSEALDCPPASRLVGWVVWGQRFTSLLEHVTILSLFLSLGLEEETCKNLFTFVLK